MKNSPSSTDPKILHVSMRPSPPDSEYPWVNVNVVIQVYDEYDIIVCDGMADEWVRSLIYEVEDAGQINQHYLNTTYSFKPIDKNNSDSLRELTQFHTDPRFDISNRIKRGWTHNEVILYKAKKPGVYFFKEYIEYNDITIAALTTLLRMKNGDLPTTSRFVPFSTISRCLRTLNTFWD